MSRQDGLGDFLAELSGVPVWRSSRGSALAVGGLVAAGIAIGAMRIGRGTVSHAAASLGQAQPGWLLAAGTSFAVALLCSAAAWRVGLRACGGTAGYTQVSARYAVGSLINAVAPAQLGGAVRLGLLSQTLTGKDRLWRVGGVGGAVAAARALVLAVLVVLTAAWGRLPFWPAPILAVGVLSVLVLCTRLGGRAAGRLGSLFEIFRVLARSPSETAGLSAWIVCAFAARLTAAAAIAVALGLPSPIRVALVLVTAIALAGVLPLTPGNFGAGAGAATLALHETGVSVGASLAAGVAFQAVETIAAMTVGFAGAAVLTSPGSGVRRWSLAATGAAVVLVAAALGVASLDLV